MPCYHPRKAWYSRDVNPSGKRSLVFDAAKGIGFPIEIPCRCCIGCKLDQAQQWATRLMHHKTAEPLRPCAFITCTYAPEHLPERGVLQPRDMDLFWKKLRKHCPGIKIQYLYCGEYGDHPDAQSFADHQGEITGRPHYHAVVYGVDFREDRRFYKKNKQGDRLYKSKTLDRLWGKGMCIIGDVTQQSCEYVTRYCLKKINGHQALEHYARIDPVTGEWYLLPREFIRMSRRPGLGKVFYDKYHTSFQQRDSVIVKGHEQKLPAYYDRLQGREDESALERVKLKRQRKAAKRKAESTPERLAVREEVRKAKISGLKRSL